MGCRGRRRNLGFLLLAGGVLLAVGCDREPAPPPTGTKASAQAQPTLEPALQATYDRTCKVCHGNAGTGAPAAGDEAAWAPRIEQGLDALLDHTINGYKGMPPMGLCMECSQDEFIAFIEYMTGLECD